MKTIYFLLAILASSCSGPETKIPDKISPANAAEYMKSNPSIVLLDVRTPEELQSGVIAGAINYNFNSGDFKNALDKLDRDKTYFVYCAVGKRSARAQQMMKENGFEKASTIEGGTNAWVAAGLPLTKP